MPLDRNAVIPVKRGHAMSTAGSAVAILQHLAKSAERADKVALPHPVERPAADLWSPWSVKNGQRHI